MSEPKIEWREESPIVDGKRYIHMHRDGKCVGYIFDCGEDSELFYRFTSHYHGIGGSRIWQSNTEQEAKDAMELWATCEVIN